MKQIIIVIVSCIVYFAPTVGNAGQAEDILAAAVRLKKAHVTRTWENCRLKGATESRCKNLLKILHKQETAVLGKLALAAENPTINRNRFSKEMAACYSPNSGYDNLIDCWERLLERLDAALNGEFLVSKP